MPNVLSNHHPGKKIGPTVVRPILVSIHDVMPANLFRVLEIFDFLKLHEVHPVTLLVVPGTGWRSKDIDVLKRLQDAGIELAGHGWLHRVDRIKTIWHRLHGLLISRKEAEHLSLSADEISLLIQNSYNWFPESGLGPPVLYVPPAWAMGKISRKRLQALPYRYYETLSGVYDSFRDRTLPMAVCGYMADTPFRALFLRGINALNQGFSFLPLRIAIHPNDLELPLAKDLEACLTNCSRFSGYESF